ncbi:MAG: hypothetical protein ACTHMS_09390 [Jatrophihabitans sp.]|uniref:hypothetical protein n=1 Tax=Jatrophihabitans sp. TaxID=1932789 RepID=UPI003F8112B0
MKQNHRMGNLRRALRQRRNDAELARVLRTASPAMRDELIAAAASDSRFVGGRLF